MVPCAQFANSRSRECSLNYCRITTDKAEAKHAVKEVVQGQRQFISSLLLVVIRASLRLVWCGRLSLPRMKRSHFNSPEYVNERTNVHLSEEEKYAARSTTDRESWAKSTVRVLIEEALSELIV